MRSIRNYRSLTLRELGEKTGIPYSRLGKFECGKEMPTDETILKIGKILNVDFNKYFNIYKKLDIENPIIRINTAFKGCSSLEKISVLPRIYHN